jgi:hypothetical protein
MTVNFVTIQRIVGYLAFDAWFPDHFTMTPKTSAGISTQISSDVITSRPFSEKKITNSNWRNLNWPKRKEYSFFA